MSKRTTLKGLYFVWYLAPGNICHGQIVGRLGDVTSVDTYLLKLTPLRGNVPGMLAIDLDTITDGHSFALYEDETACRAAFEGMAEKLPEQPATNPRFN